MPLPARACDTRRARPASTTRGGRVLGSALTLVLLTTPAANAPVPAGLVGDAVQATDAGRWCEALPLYLEIHRRSGSIRALFNAAEVAYAAGDRVAAADLYRRVQSSPGIASFEHRATVKQRVAAVFRETQRAGPGTACPAAAPRCGDWVLQEGERCDDGNAVDGDGCDSTCVPSACGNGVRAGTELCDDGNAVDGDGCDQGCVVSACGNGVRAGTEQCDDGNTINGDGCDATCVPSSCGNGVRAGAEQCDDGNTVDGDGCDRGCLVTRCGNGVKTAGERCDDGNAIDGDGCEGSCVPTRRPAPALGLTLAGGGAAALAGGGVLLAIGLGPLVGRDQAIAKLEGLRDSYASEPERALSGVEGARAELEEHENDWNRYGVLSVAAGGVVGVVGVAAAASGAWLALTHTTEDAAPIDQPAMEASP
ncbi:MAG: DUF4215 domain-containing protein [Deltaproteobacteria bacterium]|nr:DUF4215 domain-containing protein [Deltaproteobacteria bacterium]